MDIQLFIISFLVSLLACLLLTPFCAKIALKFGLVDDPKTHKHPAIIHKTVTPRAGGLPVYLSVFLSAFIFLPLTPLFSSILLAGFFVVFVGLLDDKYDISPYFRFGTNIVAAAIVALSGVVIPFVTNPLGGIFYFTAFDPIAQLLPAVLSVIWIVWVMNMLNWSKGVDGQMPGIAAISAIIIGIASLRFLVLDELNIQAAIFSFIVAGAALGFLFYNFYPARIFPGYSATILGFLLGVLSIISGVKLATALLVMGIPAVDALITVLRRTLAHKSPFWHDKGHFHHLLLSLGFGQRSIAAFYWFMSLVLGLAALALSSRGKIFAIILVLVVAGGSILTLKFIVNRTERGRQHAQEK